MSTNTQTVNENLIMQTLSEHTKLPVERLSKDNAITDIVADSFLLIELMLNLQDSLDVHLDQEDLECVHNIGDLVDLLLNKKGQSKN